MEQQMTKEGYDALITAKKQELFAVNYEIALAKSDSEKNLLREKKEKIKKDLRLAMTNLEMYGYYSESEKKGRGR